MKRVMTGLAGAVLAMTASGAMAQHDDVLALEREALGTYCETIAFRPGFLRAVDVNADGSGDLLVDYGALDCDGLASMFCGSGGCTQRVYLGRDDGGVELVGEFLAYEIVFDHPDSASFVVGIHHSGCDQDGIGTCYVRYDYADGVVNERSRSTKPPALR